MLTKETKHWWAKRKGRVVWWFGVVTPLTRFLVIILNIAELQQQVELLQQTFSETFLLFLFLLLKVTMMKMLPWSVASQTTFPWSSRSKTSLPSPISLFPSPLLFFSPHSPFYSPSVARYDGVTRKQAGIWPPSQSCWWETTWWAGNMKKNGKERKRYFSNIQCTFFGCAITYFL